MRSVIVVLSALCATCGLGAALAQGAPAAQTAAPAAASSADAQGPTEVVTAAAQGAGTQRKPTDNSGKPESRK